MKVGDLVKQAQWDNDQELKLRTMIKETMDRVAAEKSKVYKHAALPASALTSWPSVFDRMASAKLLNELKE
jgi:hypothetical protein